MRKHRRKKRVNKIFLVIAIFMLIAFILNTYLVISLNMLPIKYVVLYFIIFLVLPGLISYICIFKRLRRFWRISSYVFGVCYAVIMIVVFFYLSKTVSFVDNFTTNYKYETKNYYVLVNNDSSYESINDLEDKTLGYSSSLDSSVKNALKELDKDVSLNKKEYDVLTEMFGDLSNNTVDSIIIVDTFYEMLLESDPTIKDITKIIFKVAIKEKVNEISKDVDIVNEIFNVYVSGIDSYGSVTAQTRSDVNIIMNVNPKTHKILMINIPRDYYVTLADVNQKDKLTHAGMYGIEMSTKTIEQLLDIEINYYLKVNYNALIKVVDTLDGVDVYSNYNFTSGEGYRFKEGYNHVNGKQALEFVRTRKAFLDGDRVRGENQQAMIQAIIKKACSAEILLKYNDILDSLEDCFATNVSTDKVMALVNKQLENMPSWTITSISLNGSDGHNLTYTYPHQELYVMIPNEETILEAKLAIEANKQTK